MNKENNIRKQNTKQSIQKAYMNLCVSRRDINTITVSDICKKANINRTTFYSHYIDINNLSNGIQDWMINEFLSAFSEETKSLKHSFDFYKLFKNIKENQLFYKLYFKLGFNFQKSFIEKDPSSLASLYYKNTKDIDYHITFFSAGITAIIKKWLDEECKGSPEHMAKIIADEYQKNNTFNISL